MYFLLHGDNTQAAYEKLTQLSAKSPQDKLLKLSKEQTYDDFFQAVFTASLLDEKNMIIVQNFIKDKKIDFKNSIFKDDIKDKTVIFFEEHQLTPSQIAKVPKHFVIELFKNEPKIFWFLDSISVNAGSTLKGMLNLDKSEESQLIWNLLNRFLLLILAKKNYTAEQASKIAGRNMAPWQWQKISRQSQIMNLENLKNIYSGLLKIDYMQKTGQTSLPQKTLISYLLLKYLKA